MEDIETNVSKLKVVELKDELKKRGLSTNGVKSVLAQRLKEALAQDQEDTQVEGSPEEEMESQTTEDSTEQSEVEVNVEDQSESDTKEESEQQQTTEEEESQTSESEPVEPETAESAESAPEQPTEPTTQEPAATPNEEHHSEEPPKVEAPQEMQTAEGEAEAQTEPKQEPIMDQEPAPMEAVAEQTPAKEEPAATEDVKQAEDSTAAVNEQPSGTQQPEQQMDTSTSEEKKENGLSQEPAKDQPQKEQSDTQLGTKRAQETEAPKTETKDDPTNAPDPEEPENFDESEVLMECKFQPPEDSNVITLDKYTSDIYFNIREDGLGGCGLTEKGFSCLWASSRATVGVKGGKYYYQVRVEENVPVDTSDTEQHPHVIRVGWAVDKAQKCVGEDKRSYGYGSTGKKSTNDKFEVYGEAYGPGDVIGCYLDLESSPGTISFSKNSVHHGTTFSLDDLAGQPLFPCISTKNVSFSVNFGGSPSWCEVEGVEGYSLVQEATEEIRVRGPDAPGTPVDCEVILMVGLPASGKTTWAEKQCERYPGKRYTILGTNLIMERMKVSGLSRKENYKERFEALIKTAIEILNKMFLLAGNNLRNYIIDQTNVYKGAQERKMKYFPGFLHKAVVVIPPHHELRRRTALRNEEMGGPVPESSINAMKANFHIPMVGDAFQDVAYSDIYGMAAEKIVRQYKDDALGLPSYPQSKRGRYDNYNRGGGGGGQRYGGHRQGGGHSGYSPHQSYGSYGGGGSYGQRSHYSSGYGSHGSYGGSHGGSPYGYNQPRPRYNPYNAAPPPPMNYGHPRGGGYGGSPQYRPHYQNQSQYRGYGNTPPRRGGGGGGGGGYYGRY